MDRISLKMVNMFPISISMTMIVHPVVVVCVCVSRWLRVWEINSANVLTLDSSPIWKNLAAGSKRYTMVPKCHWYNREWYKILTLYTHDKSSLMSLAVKMKQQALGTTAQLPIHRSGKFWTTKEQLIAPRIINCCAVSEWSWDKAQQNYETNWCDIAVNDPLMGQKYILRCAVVFISYYYTLWYRSRG